MNKKRPVRFTIRMYRKIVKSEKLTLKAKHLLLYLQCSSNMYNQSTASVDDIRLFAGIGNRDTVYLARKELEKCGLLKVKKNHSKAN